MLSKLPVCIVLRTSSNCETRSNIHYPVTTPPTFPDKFQKFLWLTCVAYIACLNRAGNKVLVKYILKESKKQFYSVLSLLYVIALVTTIIQRRSKCKWRVVNYMYIRRGDGWNSPTKVGGAAEESGPGSNMKIQAGLTVQ